MPDLQFFVKEATLERPLAEFLVSTHWMPVSHPFSFVKHIP